jgi:hypothetical protein
MPVDDGLYCRYCVDKSGNLQSFEERFERMVQWTMKERSGINRQEAEQQTRAYMRAMPAWKDHPGLS